MMDDGSTGSSSLPPFLAKTYEMVDDSSTDAIVSWSRNDTSFVVWSPPEFARDLLPRYFKHNNFSSFIRQLNTYGFRKIDPEKWEFANEDFIKGQPHLLKNIHRRKPVHSHSATTQVSSSLLTETERKGYKEDIERLKSDKESLNVELQQQKEEQLVLKAQMIDFTERVRVIEQRHTTMLSSLSQSLQQPSVAWDLMPHVEAHDRKRRFRGNSFLRDETSIKDNQRASSSHTLSVENLDANSLLSSNKDLLEQLDSSLTLWEKIVHGIDEGLAQQDSSMELVESTSCAHSPDISYAQLNVDIEQPVSEIDMNTEPKTGFMTKESTRAEEDITTNSKTGVNDIFWEQFLTENPGSNNSSEGQQGTKEASAKKSETKSSDHGMRWWNMRSVNNLTEQMGHLTPAEKT